MLRGVCWLVFGACWLARVIGLVVYVICSSCGVFVRWCVCVVGVFVVWCLRFGVDCVSYVVWCLLRVVCCLEVGGWWLVCVVC